jgi:hypothetical protein
MKCAVRSVVALALLAGMAHADPDSDSDAAVRLFDEGRALAGAGNAGEACVKFEKSFELERVAATAIEVAECAVRDGDAKRGWFLYDLAAKHYQRAGQLATAKAARARADALLEQHPGLAKLERSAPELTDPEPPAAAPVHPPAAAPVAADERASARSHRRRNFAIAGAASLGVAAVLAGYSAYLSLGPIKAYSNLINDNDPENNPYHLDTRRPYDSTECGQNVEAGQGLHAFGEACRARDRQTYTMLGALAFGVAGAGMLLYAAVSRDPESNQTVAIAPAITSDGAGATLRLSW